VCVCGVACMSAAGRAEAAQDPGAAVARITAAITEENDALAALGHTAAGKPDPQDHIADGLIAESIVDLKAAAASFHEPIDFGQALGLDIRARSNIEEGDEVIAARHLKDALHWKKDALAMAEKAKGATAALAPMPCAVAFPSPFAVGETTLSLSGCKQEVTSIDMTFPFQVKKATPFAVESPTALSTGSCTTAGSDVECQLNGPMPLDATFLDQFAPALVPGEKVGFKLTFAGGAAVDAQYVVPKPPAVKVTATIVSTTATAGGSGTGPVYILTLKLSAPVAEVFLDAPAGNSWSVAGALPTTPANLLGCATSGSELECLDTGHSIMPAGTYSIVVPLAEPVAAGSMLNGEIYDGPGDLGKFAGKLPPRD